MGEVAGTWASPALVTWYLLCLFFVKASSPVFWASIFNSLKWKHYLSFSVDGDAPKKLAQSRT